MTKWRNMNKVEMVLKAICTIVWGGGAIALLVKKADPFIFLLIFGGTYLPIAIIVFLAKRKDYGFFKNLLMSLFWTITI